MKTADFDYHLPEEQIAATPATRREDARLLYLPASAAAPLHHHVFDLPRLLRPDDLLVVNDSRVIPARLLGHRAPGGGRVEALLIRAIPSPSYSHGANPTPATPAPAPTPAVRWEALVRPGKRIHTGDRLLFDDGRLQATVIAHAEGPGSRILEFQWSDAETFDDALQRAGRIPLPPYILRRRQAGSLTYPWDDGLTGPDDRERYQTVYAASPGSVAAPTAGLHFSPQLLDQLNQAGIQRVALTLHIGPGTFQGVETEDPTQHAMHEEHFELGPQAAQAINEARASQRRIVAVGTTVTRVLEHLAIAQGPDAIQPARGSTRIFILPGHTFRVVDALLTNFHLPRSTLLMLVSAFAGRERILAAYHEAIRQQYRFYSYGDATLLEGSHD